MEDQPEAAVEPGVDEAVMQAGFEMLLYCPMAWAVPQQVKSAIVGAQPQVRLARTYHEWRQKLDWLNEGSTTHPAVGHAGYYCTRCMSEVDTEGRLRYTGQA